MRFELIVAILTGSLLSAANAAPVRYTYFGPSFNVKAAPADLANTLTGITGYLVLPNAIDANVRYDSGLNGDPLYFEFSDGRTTVTPTTVLGWAFSLSTDANGEIESWAFQIGNGAAAIGTYAFKFMRSDPASGPHNEDLTEYCKDSTPLCSGPWAAVAAPELTGFVPGTWTVTPVPVPAAVWLLGSALAGLAVLRRRVAGVRRSILGTQ